MKFNLALLALVGLAAANPVPAPEAEAEPLLHLDNPEHAELLKRQFGGTGSTINELTNGACRRITFIFARGSTEPGNIGSSVGPATCDGLKRRYGSGNVACQGVGGPYTASLGDNALPGGSTTAAFNEGARLFNLAATKCPNTIITGGGYSQGGAVIHGTATRLSSSVRNRVAGLVTYGDAQALEDGFRIPPFEAAKVRIICAVGDLICAGTLIVGPAHLSYQDDVPSAVSFLAGRIGN